jgi:hypothetical protein
LTIKVMPPSPPDKPPEKRALDASVAHCLGCGRIWIGDQETGWDECPKCGTELYPVTRKLVTGELKLGDGYEARVSQDGILRDVSTTLRALIDQTKCDCRGGFRCVHCRGEDLLKKFPGPVEGSMEDDWETLRGRRRDKSQPRHEPTPREQRLLEDLLDVPEMIPDVTDDDPFGELR